LIYKLFCFLSYQIIAKNIKCCANNKVNWKVNYLPVRKFDVVNLFSVVCAIWILSLPADLQVF